MPAKSNIIISFDAHSAVTSEVSLLCVIGAVASDTRLPTLKSPTGVGGTNGIHGRIALNDLQQRLIKQTFGALTRSSRKAQGLGGCAGLRSEPQGLSRLGS